MKKWQTVLITGASSGIGKDIAWEFASRNYHVILVARSLEALTAIQNDWSEKHDCSVDIFNVDLTETHASKKVYDFVKSKNLSVDVLINNAGVGLAGNFAETDTNENLKMIDLNIRSLVELTHLFLPEMITKNRGGILNVASVAAFMPGPRMAVYFATKAFVLSFSEALKEELNQSDIHISTLCPGPTNTNFFSHDKNLSTVSMRNKLLLMSSKTVSNIAFNGLISNKTIIIPGLINSILVLLSQLSPRFLVRKISALFTK